jgi:hypothetical protein
MKLISMTSTISVIGKDTSSLSIDNEAADYDYNKAQVLNCFGSIESYINELITNEIIGKYSSEKASQIENFKAKILHTSWFNFNEKRKMVLDILISEEMNKKEKEQIDNRLRKVMSYRNSLTHGTFSTDGQISKLNYYEGSPKEQLLDDEYWGKVKSCFDYIFKLLLSTLKEKELIK